MGSLHIKDVIIGGALIILGATFVNHFAGLNIGPLNRISDVLFQSSGINNDYGGYDVDISTASEECKQALEVSGDSKIVMRKRLRDAESEGNDMEANRLQAALDDIDMNVRLACD